MAVGSAVAAVHQVVTEEAAVTLFKGQREVGGGAQVNPAGFVTITEQLITAVLLMLSLTALIV